MSAAVFTPEYRFTFVNKTASPSDVGNGTLFPLKVTVDQLAEIFYRVRDAYFTAGSFQMDLVYPDHVGIEVTGAVPPTELAWTGGRRGYGILASQALPAALDGYYGDTYTVSGGSGLYDEDYRDIKSNERGIWIPIDFPALLTGFTHSTEYTDTNNLGFPESAIGVFFTEEVAWIDSNGSGNPFDPLNSLYVGLEFNGGIDNDSYPIISTSTANFDTAEPAGINFTLEMKSGTISCPIYYRYNVDTSSVSGYDFVITAQEWWPYAKGNPAGPVWNSATGIKL